MIRVFVVAKAAVVRAGLESVVRGRAGMTVAGASATLDDAAAGPGDVILVELESGDEEAVFKLASSPETPLVVALSDGDFVARALRAGVRAVLPTEATEAEILAAVEAAAAGLVSVPAAAVESVVRTQVRESPPVNGVQPLTPREIDVLRMLAEGVPNKEIAWRLKISEHTVKFHVAQIFGKLGASSRTEAVTMGVRQGLILL